MEYLAVMFAAAAVGATGFGFNILAVPLLALTLPASDAVIIALVCGSVVNSLLSLATWRYKRVSPLVLILAGALPGIAAGTVLFSSLTPAFSRIVVGLTTVGFGWDIFPRADRKYRTIGRIRSFRAGVVSGVLTALTGMGGPPVVSVLISLLREASAVRATIALYSAAVSILGVASLVLSGSASSTLILSALRLSVPSAVGLVIGYMFFRSVGPVYYLIVAIFVLAAGAALFVAGLAAVT